MDKAMQTDSKNKSPAHRESNIELFRIITMFFIVMHHYVVNSGLTSVGGPVYENPMALNSLYLSIIGAWGKTGINCFVIITGYFMCKSKFSLLKFEKLVFEILFYSIVIYSIFVITKYEPFSISEFIKCFLLFFYIKDGFGSAFPIFYLFIPFLNILTRNMNEKQHGFLLLLLLSVYTIIGTIPIAVVTMNYVSWFIVLYFIGSYIRLYPKPFFSDTKKCIFLAMLSLSASVISILVVPQFGFNKYALLSDCNKFLAVTNGVTLFLTFNNLQIPFNPFINKVASTTFGILCIHANSDTMRCWLWKDTLNNVGAYGTSYAYIHPILSTLCVFTLCSLIDMFRIRFFEKPFLHHMKEVNNKWLKNIKQ